MKGKTYVMQSCGMVAEWDSREEAIDAIGNEIVGEWLKPPVVLDHYPTEQEFDNFMHEAQAVEMAYEYKMEKMRVDHNKHPYGYNDNHAQADSNSTHEYEIADTDVEDDGEKLEDVIENRDGEVVV